MNIKELFKKNTLILLSCGFAAGLVVFGAGSAFMSVSGSAEFCGNCHSMKHETETFLMSSHSNQQCTECHLPHSNPVEYMVEKGRTGIVDMYHEVKRDYPARIKLSASSRQMVNDNCLRCHENVMKDVKLSRTPMDTGGDCLKCHSRIVHGSNHKEGGIRIE